jgi:hypothetical protein
MVVMKGDIVINSRKEHQNMTKGAVYIILSFVCMFGCLRRIERSRGWSGDHGR